MQSEQLISSNNNTKSEQLKLLNKFLIDNPELEELSAKLGIFNIFSVLRIENTEIRHSNVLAWLMDPQGSHGIGQSFIRRFLSTILLENESTEIDLTPARIELMDVIDVEVLREWRNIDLLIRSDSNKWVLLIENKIKAGISKKQLIKYKTTVYRQYPDYTVIPVLVTLEPDEGLEIAKDSGFITYSHYQLFHVVNQVVRQRKDRIPEDAKIFIDHYLTILRRLTMQDDEIVELCKAIYRKHRDAIDLIVDWGATTQFNAVMEEFIAENKELIPLSARTKTFWFIHKDWGKYMPPCSDRWKHLSKPYPVACWFIFREKVSKIGFVIEVGSMEDSNKRLELIESFHKAKFKFGKMGFRPDAKYTRVYSIYKTVEESGDQELIRKIVDELWNKSNQVFQATSDIIASFNWE